MERKYDTRTTIFSPEGRLYQVEYAMEAISHAGAAIGISAVDGIILAAERRIAYKLLDNSLLSEKMYRIDDHIGCAVAGITADANTLIDHIRVEAQRYKYTYGTPMPVHQVVQTLSDLKQSYTQFGGLRPYGVSFLYAGWDANHGFQLYQGDPSGNFGGWKTTAIGAYSQAAQSQLKQEFRDHLSIKAAFFLAMNILCKVTDNTTLDPEKFEFAYLTKKDDKVIFHTLTFDETKLLIESHQNNGNVKD